MKSLGILLLLGTTTAIIMGALFAVTPVAAGNGLNNNTLSPSTITEIDNSGALVLNSDENDGQTSSDDNAVALAEEANGSIAIESQNEGSQITVTNDDPGSIMVSAFTVDLQKDTSSEASLAIISEEDTLDLSSASVIISSFDTFLQSVVNGNSDQITGVYADGALALNVGQQPASQPTFISDNLGEVTQFGMASEYGSLALIAHNYLSGNDFFLLSQGQIITLVYGNGSTASFVINEIRSFEALQPGSAYSDFVDLDNGDRLSASELFHNMYNESNALVLQTCIENNGISTWGRVFIIATPVLS